MNTEGTDGVVFLKRSIALAIVLLALSCQPQVLPEADPNAFGPGCIGARVYVDLEVVGAGSCSALEAAMPAEGQEHWLGCAAEPERDGEWCVCGLFSGPAADCFTLCESVGIEELGVDEGCLCRCGGTG